MDYSVLQCWLQGQRGELWHAPTNLLFHTKHIIIIVIITIIIITGIVNIFTSSSSSWFIESRTASTPNLLWTQLVTRHINIIIININNGMVYSDIS